MFVLDTNLLSELLRPRPEPAVVHWMQAQPLDSLRVTAITRAEMLYGARLLREPRREALTATVHELLQGFDGRFLPFDNAAAEIYAELAARRRTMGRPASVFDTQIAAIACAHGAGIVTRNVADFEDYGLNLINPWLD